VGARRRRGRGEDHRGNGRERHSRLRRAGRGFPGKRKNDLSELDEDIEVSKRAGKHIRREKTDCNKSTRISHSAKWGEQENCWPEKG